MHTSYGPHYHPRHAANRDPFRFACIPTPRLGFIRNSLIDQGRHAEAADAELELARRGDREDDPALVDFDADDQRGAS
jgi:hypothetical protein